MQKILTISQFAETCKKNGYSKFVYSSSRQFESAVSAEFSCIFEFRGFTYTMQPNEVVFMCEDGELVFSRVKHIILQKTKTQILFMFVCGDKHTNENDCIYTITASSA